MSSTQFPSIRAFMDYFKTHDRLEVPVGKTLLIKGIQFLFDTGVVRNGDLAAFEGTHYKFDYIMSQITLPLGFSLGFDTNGNTSLNNAKLTPDISFKPEHSLYIAKRPLQVWSTTHSIFLRLLQEDYPSMRVAPEATTGFLDHNPTPIDLPQQRVNTLLNPHTTTGQTVQLTVDKCRSGPATMNFGKSRTTLCIVGPMEMKISPTSAFSSVQEFCQYMRTVRHLNIPANQAITINGAQAYSSYKPEDVLNKMLLPWGLTASADNTLNYQFIAGATLKISCSKACKLTASKEVAIVTTLPDLAALMIASGKCYFTLDKHNTQRLTLPGFTQEDIDNSFEIETVSPVLAQQNPAGYHWKVLDKKIMFDFETELPSFKDRDDVLALWCDKDPTHLTLVPQDMNKWLVDMTHKHSSGQVPPRQRIMTALYTHLRAFHPESEVELPDTMKATTRSSFAALQKDASFRNALEALDGPEGQFALNQLQMPNAEFQAAMSGDEWPIPVKQVLAALAPIAEGELVGKSPFYDNLMAKL